MMLQARGAGARRLSTVAAGAIATALLAAGPAAAQAPSPQKGATLFKQRCATCHTLTGGKGTMGPDLKGVFGRKAGTGQGYSFSKPMRESGVSWTAAQLDAFLAGPIKVVKGARMMTVVNNPSDRADIIAYLATVR